MAATALAAFRAVPGGFFFAAADFAPAFAPADFAPAVLADAPAAFPFDPLVALFVPFALFVGALFVLFVVFVLFVPFVVFAPFTGALLADPLFVGVLFNVRRISHPAMLTTGTYLPPRSGPPSDPACPSPCGVSLWPSALPGR
ncbi:hypothetical protein [Streptomyces sp. BRA346]|uniref:hypothetical protein n=1 Tax=Streptomyces sp. BRA346 TaxID=2878199 RepID=UPI00406483B0